MNVYWKIAASILAAVILWINLHKTNKDIAALMSLAVCAMAVIAAGIFLQPVISFIEKLQGIGNLDNDLLETVLKVVGVGVVSEVACLICKDAGNESMGKTLQIVSVAAALWISLPVFEKLLTLLDNILGAV